MSFCHCQAIPDYWMTIVSSGALKGFQTIASEKSGSQSWQPSTTPRSLQEDHSAAVDSLRSNTKSAKLLGPGTDWALCSSKGLVASPNMQQFGQLNRPTLPAFAMVMIKSWLVMPHWNKWNYLIHGVCEVHISIGLWTSWNGKQSCHGPWLTRMSKPTKWVDFWHPQKQWHHQPHSSTQTPKKSRFRWEPRVSLKNSARHACCHQTHYTNGQRQTKSPHLLGLGNHWGLSVSM